VTRPDDIEREIAGLCARYGLTLSALNLGFKHRVATAEDEDWPASVEQYRAICGMASSLGVRLLTLRIGGPGSGPDLAGATDRAIGRLREMGSIAVDHGAKLTIETHIKTICETHENTLHILNQVPEIGLTYDPSHFVMRGVELQKTLALFPRIEYVHLRNAKLGTIQAPMSEGTMDIAWLLDQFAARNFSGFVAIEYLDTHPSESIESDVLDLKKLLERHSGAKGD
jgi:sugar phosphate isomerase/epimerase